MFDNQGQDHPADRDLDARTRRERAAARALAEAQARRAAYDRFEDEQPTEKGGRGGHDPVRYGDWERKGLTSDF